MISTCGVLGLRAGRRRGLDDRPHLHRVDRRIEDRQPRRPAFPASGSPRADRGPAPASGSRSLDLLCRWRAVASSRRARPGSARPGGTRAAAGRAAGSSPAARHLPEDPLEVGTLQLPEAGQRASGNARPPPSRRSSVTIRRRLARRCARRHSSAATNISFTSRSRSAPKNMCSVRQRPIPSAPKERARAASAGASALARTRRRAQLVGPRSTVLNSIRDLRRDQRHVIERDRARRPVDRDRLPPRSSCPSTLTRPRPRSMSRSEAPQTQGRPIPRATSAACEALPPSEVRMPLAAANPPRPRPR